MTRRYYAVVRTVQVEWEPDCYVDQVEFIYVSESRREAEQQLAALLSDMTAEEVQDAKALKDPTILSAEGPILALWNEPVEGLELHGGFASHDEARDFADDVLISYLEDEDIDDAWDYMLRIYDVTAQSAFSFADLPTEKKLKKSLTP